MNRKLRLFIIISAVSGMLILPSWFVPGVECITKHANEMNLITVAYLFYLFGGLIFLAVWSTREYDSMERDEG